MVQPHFSIVIEKSWDIMQMEGAEIGTKISVEASAGTRALIQLRPYTHIPVVVCLWSAVVLPYWNKRVRKPVSSLSPDWVSAADWKFWQPQEADGQKSLIRVVEVLARLCSLTTGLLWLAAKMNSCIDRCASPCADKGTVPMEGIDSMMEEGKEGKERRGDIMWSVAVCPAASAYVCDAGETMVAGMWDR